MTKLQLNLNLVMILSLRSYHPSAQSLRKYLDLMMQPSKHCSLVNHFMLNIPQQESSPRIPDSYADTNSYGDTSSFTAIAI